MKLSLAGLVGVVALLAVAFSPAVMVAAEQYETAHLGEHLLVLLAGGLLAVAVRPLLQLVLGRELQRVVWGAGIAALGLVLLLASRAPALDALADESMSFHMLEHLLILVSGGLLGTGLLALAASRGRETAPQSR